jgi:hypothetical protein
MKIPIPINFSYYPVSKFITIRSKVHHFLHTYRQTDGQSDCNRRSAVTWASLTWEWSCHISRRPINDLQTRPAQKVKRIAPTQNKKNRVVISLLLWLWISGKSSWGTSCFHLLLPNGGNRRIGSSGNLGTFLRTCAALHPRRKSQAKAI